MEEYSNGPFRKLTDHTKLIYPTHDNFCALTPRDGQKARPEEPRAQKPRVGLSRRAEHHPVHDLRRGSALQFIKGNRPCSEGTRADDTAVRSHARLLHGRLRSTTAWRKIETQVEEASVASSEAPRKHTEATRTNSGPLPPLQSGALEACGSGEPSHAPKRQAPT